MPTASPTPTFTATNTPTPKPTATPTLIPNADADDDGLANYDETVKYQTNPYLDDSDGDGISDSDWNERREYAYSVRLVMKIREPFDIETMNDLYQDARLTEGPDEEGYTLIEVVIYPDTEVDFSALPYPLAELPPDVQAYIQPGIATNYDVGIEAEVLDIVAGAETDVQVVNRLLTWVDTETTYYLDESVPEVYFTYLEDGSVRMRGFDESYVEELLRTHYFGASMFRERTHGTCTSLATLKCTILKAAGIPCRLIQTIHPIYYHEDQNVSYVNDLGREWGCVFEYPSETSASWCNHAFIEAYLGGHWIRVDQHISIYHEDPLCLNVKILSVSDWSDVDFSDTWPVDWIHDRPYYALLIEDQEQQH